MQRLRNLTSLTELSTTETLQSPYRCYRAGYVAAGGRDVRGHSDC